MENLDVLVDKAYRGQTPEKLLEAPVSAIKGVSDDDAAALKKAFNIKTVEDLASHKFVHAAQAILRATRADT